MTNVANYKRTRSKTNRTCLGSKLHLDGVPEVGSGWEEGTLFHGSVPWAKGPRLAPLALQSIVVDIQGDINSNTPGRN
jgi:hypothetical protein